MVDLLSLRKMVQPQAACVLQEGAREGATTVLNRSQQLVGMVALGNLAVYAGTQPVAAEVLEQVSEPGTSGQK